MEFFLLLITLELLEMRVQQKGSSLYEVLAYNYSIYRESIFLFIVYNFTFFYSLFLIIYLNSSNFWLISISILKFIDIFFKIYLFQSLDRGSDISTIVPADIKLTNSLKYSNLLIYGSMGLFGLELFS